MTLPHALRSLRWLAAVPLLALGCISGRPPDRPGVCCERASQAHVYTFFINGVDPKGCGNLHGLANHVRSLGFRNTCYGQFYHWGEYLNQVCKVRKEDPEAKIVLVGFSAGGYAARDIARDLNYRNIPVALVVYMAADLLRDTPNVWPPNVQRVVHIYGDGILATKDERCCLHGTRISNARNIHLNTSHIAVPRHPTTISAVTEEIMAVAAFEDGCAGDRRCP